MGLRRQAAEIDQAAREEGFEGDWAGNDYYLLLGGFVAGNFTWSDGSHFTYSKFDSSMRSSLFSPIYRSIYRLAADDSLRTTYVRVFRNVLIQLNPLSDGHNPDSPRYSEWRIQAEAHRTTTHAICQLLLAAQ